MHPESLTESLADWIELHTELILLFAALAGLMAFFAQRRLARRAAAIWREFAAAHGLRYRPPDRNDRSDRHAAALLYQVPGRLKGALRGRPFLMEVRVLGGWDHREPFTVMRVALPGLPEGFHLRTEHFLDAIRTGMGYQDITTTDINFDAAFLIQGNDPEAVRAWLNTPRRRAFLEHLANPPPESAHGISIHDGELSMDLHGVVADREVLEAAWLRLDQLVWRLRSP